MGSRTKPFNALPAIGFVLVGLLCPAVAYRTDIHQVVKILEVKPGDDVEFDVEQQVLQDGALSEQELFDSTGSHAAFPEGFASQAKEIEQLQAQKKGKKCCVMLQLPKYVDPVNGKCTAQELKTITYRDGSRRDLTLAINPENKSVSHPYSQKNPREVRVSWDVEPYGHQPRSMVASNQKLFRQRRQVSGSEETLCRLQECPVGFKEWSLSGFRFNPDLTSHIDVSDDKDLRWLEGDIRKTYGTRKKITIECYSESFKNEGSKWQCPTGLYDGWSCR